MYFAELAKTAKAMSGGSAKNDSRARVRELRDQFQSVYGMDENAMKPLLKSKSMPSIEELRKLLLPEASQVIAAGGEKLAILRHGATTIAKFRDAALDSDLSTIPVDAVASIAKAEN